MEGYLTSPCDSATILLHVYRVDAAGAVNADRIVYPEEPELVVGSAQRVHAAARERTPAGSAGY